jgi:hypothetical protein
VAVFHLPTRATVPRFLFLQNPGPAIGIAGANGVFAFSIAYGPSPIAQIFSSLFPPHHRAPSKRDFCGTSRRTCLSPRIAGASFRRRRRNPFWEGSPKGRAMKGRLFFWFVFFGRAKKMNE